MVEKGPDVGQDSKRSMAVAKQDRNAAVRLYQETDLTADEIGGRFGVSRQTVHRWIQEAGVPLRGPMGPRNRPEEQEDATPADGLLGRLMDALDESRRELAAHRAHMETQSHNLQQQIEALTAALNQLVGIQTAQNAALNDYINWMRERAGSLRPPDPPNT